MPLQCALIVIAKHIMVNYALKHLSTELFVVYRASPLVAALVSFAGVAPPQWRGAFSRFATVAKLGFPVLASGSNCAVKPTRLRRAAYFGR